MPHSVPVSWNNDHNVFNAANEGENCPLELVDHKILVAKAKPGHDEGDHIWGRVWRRKNAKRGKMIYYWGSEDAPSSADVSWDVGVGELVPYLDKFEESQQIITMIMREIWIEYVNHLVPKEKRIELSGAKAAPDSQHPDKLLPNFEDPTIQMAKEPPPWNDLIATIKKKQMFKAEVNNNMTPKLLKTIYAESRHCRCSPWETIEFLIFLHEDVYDGRWRVDKKKAGGQKGQAKKNSADKAGEKEGGVGRKKSGNDGKKKGGNAGKKKTNDHGKKDSNGKTKTKPKVPAKANGRTTGTSGGLPGERSSAKTGEKRRLPEDFEENPAGSVKLHFDHFNFTPLSSHSESSDADEWAKKFMRVD